MEPYQHLNAEAWDWESRKGNIWTEGTDAASVERARNGKPIIALTPFKPVPLQWISPFKNKKVLCLGSGGGQQAVLLSAYGCDVTDLDISQRQLEKDREMARKYHVTIETRMGDMQDLSSFPDESFPLVFNPTSTCFVADVTKVYREIFRVLPSGGCLLTSVTNPVMYLFDEKKIYKKKLVVKYTLPYSDLKSLSLAETKRMHARHDTFEFSHSMDSLIGGICRAGFVIEGFYADESGNQALDSYLGECYFGIKARKS
jgi:ubiquinone/menaquinone biosynthesis C-methylase UbiE